MDPQAPTDSELLQVRRDKLEALKAKGIAPFGGKFETTHEPGALKGNFTEALPVKVGGRVLAKRTMGKAIFFDIGDYTGRIQVYANKKEVGDEPFDMLGGLVDIGDWVGVEGETFVTRMGEKSILAKGLTFRPMSQTAPDTLAYFKSLPAERQATLKAGLKPEREKEVLALLSATKG